MMICTAECSLPRTVHEEVTATSSDQTLHRPDSLTATTTRPVPPRKPSRQVINPTTGKQVCYDFQRREGCSFGSSCRYGHVCIKPQCLGTHPQWQHQSAAIQDPQL